LDNVLGATTPGGANSGAMNRKSGYDFYVTATSAAPNPTPTYSVNAQPAVVDQTGKRYFFSDASGVIRYNAGAVATSTDAPLQ